MPSAGGFFHQLLESALTQKVSFHILSLLLRCVMMICLNQLYRNHIEYVPKIKIGKWLFLKMLK